MKLFRKPCANENQVLDAVEKGKIKFANAEEHFAQQNQYEYVRREHGYDFMPPSQYVPSRSLSEETESDQEPVRIEMLTSDLSDSVQEDEMYSKHYETHKGRSHNAAKTTRASNQQPNPPARHQQSAKIHSTPKHYRSHHEARRESYDDYRRSNDASPPRQARHHDERRSKQLPYRVDHEPQPSYNRKRDKVRSKSHHHRQGRDRAPSYEQGPDYRDENEADNYESRNRSRGSKSPREAPYAPRLEEHRSRTMPSSSSRQKDTTPRGRKGLPTAFSYNSEDSEEGTYDSRYEVGRKNPFGKYQKKNGRNDNSGWGENDKGFNEYWRHKRSSSTGNSSEIDEYVASEYPGHREEHRSRINKVENDPVLRERASPRRRRTTSRDYGMEERRRSDSRDYYKAEEKRRESHRDHRKDEHRQSLPKQRHYDDRHDGRHYSREQPKQHPEHKRQPQPQVDMKELQSKAQVFQEKRKSKGFFGRIRDSVRGDRPRKSSERENPAYSSELRNKGSLFETSDESGQSYNYGHSKVRSSYKYKDEDAYGEYAPGRLVDSDHYETPDFEPPHPRARRPAAYTHRNPLPDDWWYKKNKKSSERGFHLDNSGPVESSRPSHARRSLDRPHRPVPGANSMENRYRSSTPQPHHGSIPVIPHRGPTDPYYNSQRDGGKAVPSTRKGFGRCY